MTCDITLYTDGGREVMWMNWLRNPFGLLDWIMDNIQYEYAFDSEEYQLSVRLCNLINDFSYDNKIPFSHRDLLFDTMYEVYKLVNNLDKGYFFLQHSTTLSLPKELIRTRDYIIVTVEDFAKTNPNYLGRFTSLQSYKDWTRELLTFCELYANNDDYKFYCTN